MNRYQHTPGSNPLAAMRVSKEYVADLVERARAADHDGRVRAWSAMQDRRESLPTTPYRVAARYMRFCDATVEQAILAIAETSGLVLLPGTVKKAWYRLYPGISRPGKGVWR